MFGLEFIIGIIFISYIAASILFCIYMEKNEVLKQIYKVNTKKEWEDVCFMVSIIWPCSPLFTYIVRKRNENERICRKNETKIR